MIPWYVRSFSREYLDLYPQRDDIEARADVQAIIDLVAPPREERLLDLGCGAGRHLLALHKAGFQQLSGLDLSRELLQVARERFAAVGAERIELLHADMRHIPYEDHFAMVLSMFTSFGYFEKDEENKAVLATVSRALQPGGRFLIDYLNRDWVMAHLVHREELIRDGRCFLIERCLSEDRRRVEKKVRMIGPGGEEKIFYETVRMYTPSEMTGLLERSGFTKVRRYGSLQGAPHRTESPRLILLAEKSGGRAGKP
jgi:ubiquinone/menaquinone biosynthesis C-methylase UbiE